MIFPRLTFFTLTCGATGSCTLGWCCACGPDLMDKAPQLERTDWGARKVTYRYYDNVEEPNSHGGTSTHLKLVRATVRVGEFIKLYRKKLKYFVYHRGMVRLTSRIRVQRMGAMRPGDALIIMDFSEKLNKEKRKEAQSEHWVNTTMTIEVAVAESWRPDLSNAERDAVLARLRAATIEERSKVLDEAGVLGKRVYYHCSDYKPQVAAVTTHNMEVMLREMLALGEIKEGGTVWLKMDGCAKQYKCGKAMYLLCELALRLNLTLDQMNEVTGHGKDEADGHGGVFKNWLLSQMHAASLSDGEDADAIEMADVVDGELANFANDMCAIARAGLAELKPQAMNAKRAERSNLVKREFKTYEEKDITNPPEVKPMTAALAADAPEHADPRTKATLAHNNYRADPELQKEGERRVIMVRRLACACDGCRAHLALPIAQRYAPHDDCEHFASLGRRNDWKRVVLQPAGDEANERMEEDDAMQLQDRTDAMADAIAPGEPLAMRGKGEHAPDGYYVLDAESAPYELEADTTLHELLDDEGKPVECAKGDRVIDCVYMNLVDPHAIAKLPAERRHDRWFTPFKPGDPEGKVRVPTHMVLLAGFKMSKAMEPSVTDEDYERAWQPGAKGKYKWGPKYQRAQAERLGGRVLPKATHAAIMDELEQRGE